MQLLPVIITGVVTIAGGAGLWTYLDHRKQHEESKEDRQDEILHEVKSLHTDMERLRDEMRENDEKINQRLDCDRADSARNRILRFDDELRRKIEHSLEFFNQIMADVDWYETFCLEHPHYKNSKAEDAIRNIRECYHQVKKNNEFI